MSQPLSKSRVIRTCGFLTIGLCACDHSKIVEPQAPYALDSLTRARINLSDTRYLEYYVEEMWINIKTPETVTLVDCRQGEYSRVFPRVIYPTGLNVEIVPAYQIVEDSMKVVARLDTLPPDPVFIPAGHYERVRRTTTTTHFGGLIRVREFELQNGSPVQVNHDDYNKYPFVIEMRDRFTWNEPCHDQGGG